MLSKYFHAVQRGQEIRGGPSGTFIEGSAAALFERGYAEITARRHIRSTEHIIRWAGHRDLSASDLDDEALKHFGRHLIRCRCGRYACSSRLEVLGGARLLLHYLQGITEPAIIEQPPAVRDPALICSSSDLI
jgi:integrase/recombinase XerD